MKMPNGDRAMVTDEKLLRYILNPAHAVGGPHAKLFDRLLGINLACADVLRVASYGQLGMNKPVWESLRRLAKNSRYDFHLRVQTEVIMF
jgi:hypothetical protein